MKCNICRLFHQDTEKYGGVGITSGRGSIDEETIESAGQKLQNAAYSVVTKTQDTHATTAKMDFTIGLCTDYKHISHCSLTFPESPSSVMVNATRAGIECKKATEIEKPRNRETRCHGERSGPMT